MNLEFIKEQTSDPNLCQEISKNLWLMDDHRWALYVWELMREAKRTPHSLVHLDFHYDSVNDFKEPEHLESLLKAKSVDEIFKLVHLGELVRLNSFIAPAILRGIFSSVHFYCLEPFDDGQLGVDADVLSACNASQYVYATLEELSVSEVTSPIAFDLCLDLFNRNDEFHYIGEIWSDDEVLGVLDRCAPFIRASSIVTVSMSFGYSGTEDDTRRLALLTLPRIAELMGPR